MKAIPNTKVKNNILGFWGSIFSNFYACKFTYQNVEFISSEQAFMYHKALTFQDFEIADLILKSTSPKEAKGLGRRVKNFVAPVWERKSTDIMTAILACKFQQNEQLKAALISTEDLTLVEGSPYDSLWGCGVHWQEDDCYDQTKWKGQNRLGKVLEEVRSGLIIENFYITKGEIETIHEGEIFGTYTKADLDKALHFTSFGIKKYPLSQFSTETEDGFIPGYLDLYSKLTGKVSTLRKMNFFTKKRSEFDSKSILSVLVEGNISEEIQKYLEMLAINFGTNHLM